MIVNLSLLLLGFALYYCVFRISTAYFTSYRKAVAYFFVLQSISWLMATLFIYYIFEWRSPYGYDPLINPFSIILPLIATSPLLPLLLVSYSVKNEWRRIRCGYETWGARRRITWGCRRAAFTALNCGDWHTGVAAVAATPGRYLPSYPPAPPR